MQEQITPNTEPFHFVADRTRRDLARLPMKSEHEQEIVLNDVITKLRAYSVL